MEKNDILPINIGDYKNNTCVFGEAVAREKRKHNLNWERKKNSFRFNVFLRKSPTLKMA